MAAVVGDEDGAPDPWRPCLATRLERDRGGSARPARQGWSGTAGAARGRGSGTRPWRRREATGVARGHGWRREEAALVAAMWSHIDRERRCRSRWGGK
jgi:hypothetical protein